MRPRLTPEPRIRLGISACLLGDEVRYDGGHKRDAFLTTVLGPLVEWVKVCPEVEVGMGTPRESIRLVDEHGAIRLLTVKTGIDYTAPMAKYAAQKMNELVAADLCGYVLKKDSPSCGMTGVKVYGSSKEPQRVGVGLFAQALFARFPHLPVEEEGRLTDLRLRENFVERVFAYRGLRDLFEKRWTIGDLVRFHAAHELVLMVHSSQVYTRLGRVIAGAREADRDALRAGYTAGFMNALEKMATPGRHINALKHLAGYFKKSLDAASRAELQAAIDDYRLGRVPLLVPVTLFRHHARVHEVEYLAGQVYLAPHPKELLLRNQD